MRRTATIVALMLAGALAVGAAPASATPASTVTCGQTLTHSVRLANDLSDCPGDGLVIGAPGITVDLNGHTIDGVATQIEDCDVSPFGSAGIQNSGGYDGLTIKNGTLQQFFSGFNAGSDPEAMADSRLVHLVARDNRFSGLTMGSGAGDVTNDNRIIGNTVTGNGCRRASSSTAATATWSPVTGRRAITPGSSSAARTTMPSRGTSPRTTARTGSRSAAGRAPTTTSSPATRSATTSTTGSSCSSGPIATPSAAIASAATATAS